MKNEFSIKPKTEMLRTTNAIIRQNVRSVQPFTAYLSFCTIFAKSSGQGKCGVSVIRVSGPQTKGAVMTLTKNKLVPETNKYERQATLRKLFHPESGEILDSALVLWFKEPRSFTGEDCCEFHVHGGLAVVSAVLAALSKIPGLRHAKPGEFTRRAFFNGKLNLTEIEGLADLIHAETEVQRKQALREMDGALTHLYSSWRKRLIKCTANVEAWIDFSEEENIEENAVDLVRSGLNHILKEVNNHLQDKRRGERLRNGIQAVIVGKPNVGKSSLLNSICQRPVSIVSPIAGTTRDVVDSAFDIGGYAVLFSDTAGLRTDTGDIIEVEGVKRARKKLEEADLAIVMLDIADFINSHENKILQFEDSLTSELNLLELPQWINEKLNKSEVSPSPNIMLVFNKCDELSGAKRFYKNFPLHTSFISCKTGDGIVELIEKLEKNLEILGGNPLSETGNLLRERHIQHLRLCRDSILECMDWFDSDMVIAARKLRIALNELGKITGEVRPDDILDVIFKDFCIGK